jgi:hypothetical protein
MFKYWQRCGKLQKLSDLFRNFKNCPQYGGEENFLGSRVTSSFTRIRTLTSFQPYQFPGLDKYPWLLASLKHPVTISAEVVKINGTFCYF